MGNESIAFVFLQLHIPCNKVDQVHFTVFLRERNHANYTVGRRWAYTLPSRGPCMLEQRRGSDAICRVVPSNRCLTIDLDVLIFIISFPSYRIMLPLMSLCSSLFSSSWGPLAMGPCLLKQQFIEVAHDKVTKLSSWSYIDAAKWNMK